MSYTGKMIALEIQNLSSLGLAFLHSFGPSSLFFRSSGSVQHRRKTAALAVLYRQQTGCLCAVLIIQVFGSQQGPNQKA
jgi:hypothetical protein